MLCFPRFISAQGPATLLQHRSRAPACSTNPLALHVEPGVPRSESSFPLPGSTSSYQQGNPEAHSSPQAEPAPGRAGCSTQRCQHPEVPPSWRSPSQGWGQVLGGLQGAEDTHYAAGKPPTHLHTLSKQLPAPPQALTAPVGTDTGVPHPLASPGCVPSLPNRGSHCEPCIPRAGMLHVGHPEPSLSFSRLHFP